MTIATTSRTLIRSILPDDLWDRLRIRRADATLKRYPQRVVRHLYGDSELSVLIADPTGERWYDRDWAGVPELDALRPGRLGQGATVFDLGAHQGVVALLLAREVGAGGKVVAVEAHPHNARVAKANIELNSARNLVVQNAAVAERSGTLSINMALGSQVDTGSSTLVRHVPAVTIDDLSDQYGFPDVLFIDIEGYEARVFQGAKRTMETRPDCAVEVHSGCGLEEFGGSTSALIRFFLDADYQLFAHTESEPNLVRLESPADAPAGRMFLTALSAG